MVWVIIFLGIGKVFGPQWMGIFHLFEVYALWIVSGVAALAALIAVFRYRRFLAVYVLRRKPELKLKTKLKEPSKER
ncbi:hypothetical protein D3C75_410450 [compost metagenome]